MMVASMWNIPNVTDMRTPLSIMKEQGNMLAVQTNWLLAGHASAAGSAHHISNEFRIVVPILNNYTYSLANYDQEPDAIFPGELSSPLLQSSIRVKDIGEFEFVFGELLRSNKTIELLRSLLAQANALSN